MRTFGRSFQTAAKWFAAASSLAVLMGLSAPAHAAIDVTCVEASRYKYIYQIFDNDPKRFAAYFGTDQRQLPNPEACRAVVITGSMELPERGAENDADRLVDAIQQGHGWLSTVYLASPGGKVAMGLRLGALTRMFWLNTITIENGEANYVPDFLGGEGPGSAAVVPPELKQGFANYVAATESLSNLKINDGRSRRCASACTYIHAAGIYRAGNAYIHRIHSANGSDTAADAERLKRSGDRVIAFYRTMEAGDEAVQAFQQATTDKLVAVDMPMAPKQVGDALKQQCGGTKRPFPTTAVDLRCVAAGTTRDRLAKYAKLCRGDCDSRELIHDAGQRIRALLPEETSQREPVAMQRGYAR